VWSSQVYIKVPNSTLGISTFSLFQRNMLNWNGNSFLCKRPWQSMCIIMLLLLLLWIWMTVKLEAIQQTSSFLLSVPDKKAKLLLAWKPVTSSGSWQLYNKNRWQTILLSSYFLLLFIFRLCFISVSFHPFPSSENRNGQSRWIGLARWKAWVKSGVQWGVCMQCKCYVNCGEYFLYISLCSTFICRPINILMFV
jgi:hypothetical protein